MDEKYSRSDVKHKNKIKGFFGNAPTSYGMSHTRSNIFGLSRLPIMPALLVSFEFFFYQKFQPENFSFLSKIGPKIIRRIVSLTFSLKFQILFIVRF